MPARLPSWRSYLAGVEDPARRRAVWAWLAQLRPALRRKATHIVDFALSPAPGETLDDKWVPVAHDHDLGLWLVRR